MKLTKKQIDKKVAQLEKDILYFKGLIKWTRSMLKEYEIMRNK